MLFGGVRSVFKGVAVCCCFMGCLLAQEQVGFIKPYTSESPHPYPLGGSDRPVAWQERVVSPGATFLRIHFPRLSLAKGDYLSISSADGSQNWSYPENGPYGDGEFWAFTVNGDEAVVRIHGGSTPGYGYSIDAVGYGTVDLASTVPARDACPLDHVVCHQDDKKFWAVQKPVARLMFTRGDLIVRCTGWLIQAAQKDTLMTNYHCLTEKVDMKSVEARFNYQALKCDGEGEAEAVNYAGDKFLTGEAGLDYTLITLKGSPQDKWGAVTATTKAVKLKDTVYMPQHPSGGLKKVAWFDRESRKSRCEVEKVGLVSVYYDCGGEPASSGSPVQDATTGNAIALHTVGETSAACAGHGSGMAAICDFDQEKGKYLKCAKD